MANQIKTSSALSPVNVIRTETALSRYPIHRLAKRGEVMIDILRKDESGATAFRWEVSHSNRYGQPGPLAYKLDTLVINRKLEEAGRPVPKVIRLGSLRDVADMLDLGADTNLVRRALFQNAFAGITMKGAYKSNSGEERNIDAAFTRYAVVMTGQKMPDGKQADAVYIVLHDIFQEVLNHAILRPLDYDYLKMLTPAAQRWYELVSYQMYAALKYDRPRAKFAYSEFCACSTMTRYSDYEQVKKQMYKIHRPHLIEEYLERVEMEPFVDEEGIPDWLMWYWPGRRARSQYDAFLNRRKYPRMQGDLFPNGEGAPNEERKLLELLDVDAERAGEPPPPAPIVAPLVEVQHSEEEQALIRDLTAQGLNQSDAVRFARENPDECRRQLEYLAYVTEFKSSRGAYLRAAVEKGFGPPKSYEEAKAKAESRQREESRTRREKARQNHEAAHQEAYLAYLRCREGEVLEAAPETYAAFLAGEERSRAQFGRMKAKRLLMEWDTEPGRLRRFQEAFKDEVLDFWAWDAKINPQRMAT